MVVTEEAFAATAAGLLARAIAGVPGRPIAIALAGGTTPRRAYRALAAHRDLPWGSVRVFFGDERAVGPDDEASNYRMARESLLSHVPVLASHVFRMPAERPDREAAAAEYEAVLPDALDVLVLGIGSDGHTASLFPGAPVLRETVRLVRPALGPDPPRERLTITPPVIARARTVIVLASGAEKAAAVKAALEGAYDPRACPAQLARDALWFLDTAAASALMT